MGRGIQSPRLVETVTGFLRKGKVPSSFRTGSIRLVFKTHLLMSTISPCLQPSFPGEGDEKCFDGASLALPGILRFLSPLSAWFCTWVWYGDSAGWVEDLLLLMDKGQVSMLILLDLSAAFDTGDHEVLLRHLRTLAGVDGVALEWFHFFSSERSQRVALGNYSSAPGLFHVSYRRVYFVTPLVQRV